MATTTEAPVVVAPQTVVVEAPIEPLLAEVVPAPQQTEGEAVQVAEEKREEEVKIVQQVAEKEEEKKKEEEVSPPGNKRRGVWGSSSPLAKKARTPAVPKPKKVTGRSIEKALTARAQTPGPVVRDLFTYEDSISLSDSGSVRYGECVLKAPLGPLPAMESVAIIDWIASASTLIVSKTGKIGDTLAFDIKPVAISVDPIPLV